MKKDTIGLIVRAGSVIVTSIISFVILPPVLNPTQTVIWQKVLVFFSGFLSIILFDKFANKKHLKPYALTLVTVLILLISLYEVFYQRYSIDCFDKVRIIISSAAVKPQIIENYQFWQSHSQRPMGSLLEAYSCSATEVWDMKNLFLPYYGLLVLYFLITAIFILLLVIVTDILNKKDIEPNANQPGKV